MKKIFIGILISSFFLNIYSQGWFITLLKKCEVTIQNIFSRKKNNDFNLAWSELPVDDYRKLMRVFWTEFESHYKERTSLQDTKLFGEPIKAPRLIPGYFKDCDPEISEAYDNLVMRMNSGDCQRYNDFSYKNTDKGVEGFYNLIEKKRIEMGKEIHDLRESYRAFRTPENKEKLQSVAKKLRNLVHKQMVLEEREMYIGDDYKDGKRVNIDRDIIYYLRFEKGLEPEEIFEWLYCDKKNYPPFLHRWREYVWGPIGFGCELEKYPKTLAKYKELTQVK